jgi:membrane-associated phospholipid phosphatase
MFEAVNTISRKYESYNGLQEVIVKNAGIPKEMITADQVSINSAIVEAAYETLKALYPKKTPFFDNAHDLDYTQLHGSMSSLLGEEIGRQAAKAVLALRANDGSELPDLSASDFDSNNPNTWHQDPITQLKPALGGNWFRVKPFEIASADAFLPKPPPLIGSADFVEPYKKVKRLGSDPHAVASGTRWPTQTVRTGAASPNNPVPADNTNQTFVGIFWAYDGTPSLCAPPRLYNMIATSVALNEVPISTVEDMSCYLAFINICLADAGIAAWNAKYHYLYPRPITVIRALSADSTPEGASDSRWTPLGGQVSNGPDSSKNLTPNFPSYPSGHATFGGALFRAMYRFLRTPPEGVKFHFISDEYNGLNRGLGESQPRQLAPADFQSFKEAEYLNAESRVYLGIHWEFDATEGIIQGNLISDDIYPKFVRPTH